MNQPANPSRVEEFGRYRLLRKIGQGGMAEVFLAEDSKAAEGSPPVVIKRLHDQLEKDRDAVDLFLTEADVTMMLDHPNIIRVYDCGEVGNRYYMCMEYVHGKDLEQIWNRCCVKGTTLDADVCVHIMCKVLQGLAYVHSAKTQTGRPLGIVHRDVTPSNIYVSSSGNIKLGDFGVAKLMGVEGWTMAGSLKGKLGYISPEQIAAQEPSQSIDLWAASIILYELLAGERVFTGENELEVMLRIKSAKIKRIRKANKAVPKVLEKLLKRALHKKERKRHQSANELIEDLEAIQNKSRRYTDAELVEYLTHTLS
ncbi:MAG: serine/threonine-protein kinase [Myxococcota bacterium]